MVGGSRIPGQGFILQGSRALGGEGGLQDAVYRVPGVSGGLGLL